MKKLYETTNVQIIFTDTTDIFTSGESQTPPDRNNELPILPFRFDVVGGNDA
ncbi:MAG: hypothetical protein IIX01_02090 [Clostridia bacterium]|nr:hypothetical protein [Clostridia bacterium]